MKTREQIYGQTYLNISDIKILLDISRRSASRVYALADEIDSGMPFRIELHKVRLTSVLKVAGVDLNTLQKQIKGTPSRGK